MKRFIVLCLFLLCGIASYSNVYAVVDTGGGDVSNITDNSDEDYDEDYNDYSDEDWDEDTDTDYEDDDSDEESESSDSASSTEISVEAVTGHFIPNVKPENFFQKIYSKLHEVNSFAQMCVAIILMIFFILALLMLGISFFGDKKKIPQYLIALLVLAILFVCDVYAGQILASFTAWMAN